MDKGEKLLIFLALVVVGALLFSSVPALAGENPRRGKSLAEARQALEQQLRGVPGFVGIAHSKERGEITVFVENEQARGIAPQRFEGYPVRVEVTGKIQALATQVAEPTTAVSGDTKGEVRPLVGGISLSAYVTKGRTLYLYAGTLGMVTYNDKILSNAHVIAMEPGTHKFLNMGTPIIQPGTLDGGRLANRAGELEAYIPIVFGPGGQNYADAAIGSIDGGVSASPGEQYRLDEQGNRNDYNISGTATVDVGHTLRKSGRTTGVTTGAVVHTNASVWVWYGSQRAYFVDQIAVAQTDWSFAAPGDSGSAVDKGGQFVGLVFAGSEAAIFINKAEHIIAGLGIAVEPVVPPTLKSITVTPETATIAVGESQQFTVIGIYDDGSERDLTEEVEWASSDESIATIDERGVATGVAGGEVTITATLDDLVGEASLTVEPAPEVTEISATIIHSTSWWQNPNFWRASVTVLVIKVGTEAPVEGAKVTGTWNGASVSGFTDSRGEVTLSSNKIRRNVSSVTFRVVAVEAEGYLWDEKAEEKVILRPQRRAVSFSQ